MIGIAFELNDFIEAELVSVSPTGKTKVHNIRSIANKGLLGSVYWFGAWRKYIFNPMPSCIFDEKCLRAIADFLKVINEEHKSKRKVRK